jgi:acetyltransferase-like isoleucine patch superfamily enzyme
MAENPFVGLRNRVLQRLAMTGPGATSFRVWMHKLRGVEIGEGVWIGYEALIETSYPKLVHIGDRVILGIRTTIIAHFHDTRGVWIEEDVFIGPCVTILPGVRLGKGCVIAAGTVVTMSVPAMTMMAGNPAKAVARCGIPLGIHTSGREFTQNLKKIGKRPSP